MQVSDHFTLEELLKSKKADELGIENVPNTDELKNIFDLVYYVLEPVRKLIDIPIEVNSCFRCEELNKVIGGKSNSQHKAKNGAAADLTCGSKELNRKLFLTIKDYGVFDQLINEYNFSWIHVSYVSENKNRKQIVTII
jgi:hypothetical protein